MDKRAKFSFIYYLVILVLMLLFQVFLISGPEVKELPYSEFRALLAADKIKSVVITQEKITGELKQALAG